LTNALTGEEDHLICRETRTFWDELEMWSVRQEVVHDVEVEWAAGRLRWSFEGVSSIIVDFPARGGRADLQPDDEGSEPDSDAGNSDTTDGDDGPEDGPDGGGGGGGDATAAAFEDASAAAAAPAILPSDSSALALTADEATDVHNHQFNLDVLSAVLEQVKQIGNDRLVATLSAAKHAEEKKARGRLKGNAIVAKALWQNQAEDIQRRMQASSLAAQMDKEGAEHRARLKELEKEEARLEAKRLALAKVTSVTECLQAVKSFGTQDLGQGHAQGGTAVHARNRMPDLDRVRHRGSPLRLEQANDWDWFKRKWDKARIGALHPNVRDSWASTFKNIMNGLLVRIRNGEHDAVSKWMAAEARQYLGVPALRI